MRRHLLHVPWARTSKHTYITKPLPWHTPFAPKGPQHVSPGQGVAVQPRSAALGEKTNHADRPERAQHGWMGSGIERRRCAAWM